MRTKDDFWTKNTWSGFLCGHLIFIGSYGYGGLYVRNGEHKRIINIQTPMYQWEPAAFHVCKDSGLVLFKTNEETFYYDVQTNSIGKITSTTGRLQSL